MLRSRRGQSARGEVKGQLPKAHGLSLFQFIPPFRSIVGIHHSRHPEITPHRHNFQVVYNGRMAVAHTAHAVLHKSNSMQLKPVTMVLKEAHIQQNFSVWCAYILCKIGGFLDLHPWKPAGNLIRSLVGNLGKSEDTACLQRRLVET